VIGRNASAVAVAAGLVLAACGSGSTAKSGAQRVTTAQAKLVRAASDATASAGSARLAMTIHMRLPEQHVDITYTASGVETLTAPQSVDMTMDMNDLIRTQGGDPKAFGPDGYSLHELMLDGVMYMRFPQLVYPSLHLDPSKPWLKVDMTAVAGKDLGSAFQSLTGGDQSADMTQYLAFLSNAASGIRRVGTDTVRDEPTTHFRATLDLQGKALDSMSSRMQGGMTDAQRRAFVDLYRKLGVRYVPIDAWIDGAGRARKMELDLPLDMAGAGKGHETLTMELYDFGTPVSLVAPSADQVQDGNAFMANATKMLGG